MELKTGGAVNKHLLMSTGNKTNRSKKKMKDFLVTIIDASSSGKVDNKANGNRA